MSGEVHRYLKKGHAGKINVMVFPEVEDALMAELRSLRKRIYVLKERPNARPTPNDLGNHILVGWLCLSRQQREGIRALGQAQTERRQRSAEPIPFDLDAAGGTVYPEPGGGSVGRGIDRGRRRKKDGRRDGEPIRDDR